MTRTDYVKARLDLLKLEITGILGIIFALGLYDFQTDGAYSFGVWTGLGVLIILFFILVRIYYKIMAELEDLP